MEFHLFDGPGGQNRAIYTAFGYVIATSARTSNRPGGNRTGEVNKQLLPVGYLIDLNILTCSFQVGFLGDEQVGVNK